MALYVVALLFMRLLFELNEKIVCKVHVSLTQKIECASYILCNKQYEPSIYRRYINIIPYKNLAYIILLLKCCFTLGYQLFQKPSSG